MESLYDISPGRELVVEEAGLRVGFVSVDEDSRCPVGVNCVWAGNVRVALSLSLDESEDRRVSLNTAFNPRAVRFRGRRISIKKVAPPKIEGERIKPDEYVITLVVASAEGNDAGDEETLDLD